MKKEQSGIPSLSVGKAVDQLSAGYAAAILGGMSPKVIPSVMMELI